MRGSIGCLFLLITFFLGMHHSPVSLHSQQFLVENWTLCYSDSGLCIVLKKIIGFLFVSLFYYIVTFSEVKLKKSDFSGCTTPYFVQCPAAAFETRSPKKFGISLVPTYFSSQKFKQIYTKILRLILPMIPVLCGSPEIFSCYFSTKFFSLTS